jgi:hypothetical protein
MKKVLLVLSLGVLVLAASAAAERWPLGPGNVLQPNGNNPYEFQNYGGSSYYHDGLDVLGQGGDPCYSVDNGYVSLIRINEPMYTGIIINYTKGQDKGWLYWHITYSTIPFIEGDPVPVDARIGNIATWPVASFHHVHFTRSYYPGVIGWYDSVDNAIEFMVPAAETDAPEFREAESGQWFSFCENNGTVRVDPGEVKGQVDVIALIGDKIGHPTWLLVPYEITWWVTGQNGNIPPTTFLKFTGATPPSSTVTTVVYKREGQWYTRGDYNNRDFYFVVTNTDGDGEVEVGDEAYHLDTTTLTDGLYTFYVQAKDFAGNTTQRSMEFTIKNGSSDITLTSFTARAVRGGVEVEWAAREKGAVTYNLYRREAAEAAELGGGERRRLNAEPISGRSPYSYLDEAAAAGRTYEYWLEAVELSGKPAWFGPVKAEAGTSRPKAFALHGVAPNPVRGEATFAFAVPEACHAELAVYDLAGRRVATVVDADVAPGEYEYGVPLSLAPGAYLYRLTAGEFAAAKRFVVAP